MLFYSCSIGVLAHAARSVIDPASFIPTLSCLNNCVLTCLTCQIFKPDTTFRSSVTGKTYKVIGSGDWSCNTSNVVYLVTCQRCGLQYVGETSQALRKRMNNHRANIKSLKPQFLYKHFTSDGHRLEDMFVQPIESMQ